MEAVLILIVLILVVGFILLIVALCRDFSKVDYLTYKVYSPSHTYTEGEFITLYNYCARKRNATIDGYSAITSQKRIVMDNILNYCDQSYDNPYQKCDYTDLCLKLLSLLPQREQEEINWGILKS